MSNIYIYGRVSDPKQDLKNQMFGINEYVERQGYNIESIVSEIVRSATHPRKRELGKLLSVLKKGDLVICSELSRLSRTNRVLQDIRYEAERVGYKIFCIKDNITIGERLNIGSDVMMYIYGLQTEKEKSRIKARTRETLQRYSNEIKENGFFISKSGKKCTKLGAPDPVSNLQKAWNTTRLNAAQKIANNKDRMIMFDLIGAYRQRGEFWHDIADMLNERGYKTPKGYIWSKASVCQAYRIFKKNEHLAKAV